MSLLLYCVFFFKQKTAYELRISDWSSDVCSSDLSRGQGCRNRDAAPLFQGRRGRDQRWFERPAGGIGGADRRDLLLDRAYPVAPAGVGAGLDQHRDRKSVV